jgi:protein-disulfide isomerase
MRAVLNKIPALLFAGMLSIASIVTPAQAAMTEPQKKEITDLVREYLLANPEILRDMANSLEEKSRADEDQLRLIGLQKNAEAVYRLKGDPQVGPADANVTIVEFLDYNCGWCKKSVAEIAELTKSDKKVRLIFKEFPIFGGGSEYAAKAALASAKQNKYWDMHQALFASEAQVTEEVTDAIAKKVGVDVVQMKKDMGSPDIAAVISANQELAKALAINGTPAFVIGDEVVPGYIPLTALSEKVSGVRANGCKLC